MAAGTPTGQNMPLKPFPLDAGAANMLGRAQFQGLIWFCASWHILMCTMPRSWLICHCFYRTVNQTMALPPPIIVPILRQDDRLLPSWRLDIGWHQHVTSALVTRAVPSQTRLARAKLQSYLSDSFCIKFLLPRTRQLNNWWIGSTYILFRLLTGPLLQQRVFFCSESVSNMIIEILI